MASYGLLAESQVSSNVPVRLTHGHVLEHLDLARGQQAGRVGRHPDEEPFQPRRVRGGA